MASIGDAEVDCPFDPECPVLTGAEIRLHTTVVDGRTALVSVVCDTDELIRKLLQHHKEAHE